MARHHVGVDGRRHMRVGVTEALADVGQRHTGGEQLRSVRVAQCVKAGALGSLRLLNSSETDAEIVSGFSGEPSGLLKMKFP